VTCPLSKSYQLVEAEPEKTKQNKTKKPRLPVVQAEDWGLDHAAFKVPHYHVDRC
jgi:hypothetical protein